MLQTIKWFMVYMQFSNTLYTYVCQGNWVYSYWSIAWFYNSMLKWIEIKFITMAWDGINLNICY